MSSEKIIEAAWDNYRASMVPPNTSPEAEQALRMAFFGGYTALWRRLTQDGGAFQSPEDVSAIDDEIAGYLSTPDTVVEIYLSEVLSDMAQRLLELSAASMRIDQETPIPAMEELDCADRHALYCAATGAFMQALSAKAICQHGMTGIWRGFCTSYALTAMGNNIPRGAALDALASHVSGAWDEELASLMREAKTVGLAS